MLHSSLRFHSPNNIWRHYSVLFIHVSLPPSYVPVFFHSTLHSNTLNLYLYNPALTVHSNIKQYPQHAHCWYSFIFESQPGFSLKDNRTTPHTHTHRKQHVGNPKFDFTQQNWTSFYTPVCRAFLMITQSPLTMDIPLLHANACSISKVILTYTKQAAGSDRWALISAVPLFRRCALQVIHASPAAWPNTQHQLPGMARVEEMCHSFLTSILDAYECCPKVWSLILITTHFAILTKHCFGTDTDWRVCGWPWKCFCSGESQPSAVCDHNRRILVKNCWAEVQSCFVRVR
jgi:hypothetical protein